LIPFAYEFGVDLEKIVPLKYIQLGSGIIFILFGIIFLINAVLGFAWGKRVGRIGRFFKPKSMIKNLEGVGLEVLRKPNQQ